jgi:hypothetical protein
MGLLNSLYAHTFLVRFVARAARPPGPASGVDALDSSFIWSNVLFWKGINILIRSLNGGSTNLSCLWNLVAEIVFLF